MSKSFATLLLAALTLPVSMLAQGAAAASTGGTKVGIINMQTAIVATNEGQRDFEALAKKFEPKRTELKSMSDELDSMKKQLDTQGSKLNDDARADLVKKIEAKQKSLSRASEDAQSDLQAQQNEIEDDSRRPEVCQGQQPGHDSRCDSRLARRRTDLGYRFGGSDQSGRRCLQRAVRCSRADDAEARRNHAQASRQTGSPAGGEA
jgi:Skp family chaperone for outer membrane proteins